MFFEEKKKDFLFMQKKLNIFGLHKHFDQKTIFLIQNG